MNRCPLLIRQMCSKKDFGLPIDGIITIVVFYLAKKKQTEKQTNKMRKTANWKNVSRKIRLHWHCMRRCLLIGREREKYGIIAFSRMEISSRLLLTHACWAKDGKNVYHLPLTIVASRRHYRHRGVVVVPLFVYNPIRTT